MSFLRSRRDALKTFALALLAACDSVVARLKGRRLVAVTAASSVTADSAHRSTVEDQPIIVVRDGGKVRAFLALCTHEGCPLGWNPTQRLIRCPCHGSAFSTAGRVVQGPAQNPLRELPTYVNRDSVMIDAGSLEISPRS